MASDVKEKAEEVTDSFWLKGLARIGLVAYGVVYLLIGWLALQLAWGNARRSPDPAGAFQTLAEQPLGSALLVLSALVLAALGVWQASEMVWGHRDLPGAKRLRERIRSGFWAGIYAGLGCRGAWVAVQPHVTTSHVQERVTVGVLAWPGGRAIVVAGGLVVISIGVAAAIRGFRKSFSAYMDTASLTATSQGMLLLLGQIGYVTKGVALGLVGGLLTSAAWTFEAHKTSGLDAALHAILQQPFGKWLLSTMAFGFIAFGLFAMLQFRYRRM